MTLKIGINGFGRIGRLVVQIAIALVVLDYKLSVSFVSKYALQ
jgi:glyceraldehyde-3-phosphate dehydrogenase/erythrose-4-phosphate dehydrogenase